MGHIWKKGFYLETLLFFGCSAKVSPVEVVTVQGRKLDSYEMFRYNMLTGERVRLPEVPVREVIVDASYAYSN